MDDLARRCAVWTDADAWTEAAAWTGAAAWTAAWARSAHLSNLERRRSASTLPPVWH